MSLRGCCWGSGAAKGRADVRVEARVRNAAREMAGTCMVAGWGTGGLIWCAWEGLLLLYGGRVCDGFGKMEEEGGLAAGCVRLM